MTPSGIEPAIFRIIVRCPFGKHSKSRVSKVLLNVAHLVFKPDDKAQDQSAEDIGCKIFHIIQTPHPYLFFP